MKKVLSAVLALLLLLLSSCGAKTEDENVASYYKDENLTEAEKFVNESKIFPAEYIGSFDTDSPLERREFATVLYKLAGEPDVENDLKLTQIDASAFYYDACMFTACNDMTFDIKIPGPEGRVIVRASLDTGKIVDPIRSVYIDDIKVPHFEVIYGLYNYAKYAKLECETKPDFSLLNHNATGIVNLWITPCYRREIESFKYDHVSREKIDYGNVEINDCYAWAVNYDIIEADGDGNYEIEDAITHGEFAEIMQKFYTNVLNA